MRQKWLIVKLILNIQRILMTSQKSGAISTYLQDLFLEKEITQKTILFEVVRGNQAHIIFNRPKRLNAFSMGMYLCFIRALNQAEQMEEIKYVVIKGAGSDFCSGNDLANFVDPNVSAIENKRGLAKAMGKDLETLTERIVNSTKPIFCIVQGKVIGFAFTQLALYDRVFATQDSSFVAPLVKIAQGPEMGSSYTFPRIFGQVLAEDIIIKGTKMNPQQLEKYGLVTVCTDLNDAEQRLQQHISELEELQWNSYREARRLMREPIIQGILRANRAECINLIERWTNPDLAMFLMQHMAKQKQKNPKSKL